MSSTPSELPEPEQPPAILPQADPPQATRPRRVIKTTHIEQHFSGPLPTPATLKEFDTVLPGCAERIVRMAENQASHRQELEKIVISGDNRRANHGLYIGGLIVVLFLAGSVFLIYTGHDWAGGTLATLDLSTLAGAFIYSTNSRRDERTQKAKLMNPEEQPTDED